jgi:hypothetical protein
VEPAPATVQDTGSDRVTFRLDGERVIQTEPDGSVTTFDPNAWGVFTRGSRVVHAVKIPRPFKVGGDICLDGYLVYDGRLFPISSRTFAHDYEALDARLALERAA